jgi:hypothetical protein
VKYAHRTGLCLETEISPMRRTIPPSHLPSCARAKPTSTK